jgi:hypothetical protein
VISAGELMNDSKTTAKNEQIRFFGMWKYSIEIRIMG